MTDKANGSAPEALEEWRRRAYLEAMGVTLWEWRGEQAEAPPEAAREPQAAAGVPVAAGDWDALAGAVAACTRCALHQGRTQTVFGVGDRGARLMIVGEAPGAEEDRRGEPFVGAAGQLLDAMLKAIGLERRQVFIANILKCRPPSNRDPRPEEVAACHAYLQRQIEWVAPRLLLAVGRIAAQNLLRSEESIGRLRGRVHRHEESGTAVLATYHPAYLLRSPGQKRKAWEDLKQVRELLRDGDGSGR